MKYPNVLAEIILFLLNLEKENINDREARDSHHFQHLCNFEIQKYIFSRELINYSKKTRN